MARIGRFGPAFQTISSGIKSTHRAREKAGSPQAHDQTRDSAEKREQKPFGEQLPDDAPPAAAKRQANRDLFPPRRAPRQQHVREIQTRHEQHHRRHSDEQRRDRSDLAVVRWIIAQREARHRPGGERLVFLLNRICALQIRRQRFHGRFGCGRGHSFLKPGDQHQLLAGAAGQCFVLDRSRNR